MKNPGVSRLCKGYSVVIFCCACPFSSVIITLEVIIVEHYSKKQVEILKNLEKGYIDLSDNRSNQDFMSQYYFLKEEGLIFVGFDNDIDFRPFIAKILPKGEAYLECLRIDERRFKVPIAFSFIASVTAVVSLLVSLFN